MPVHAFDCHSHAIGADLVDYFRQPDNVLGIVVARGDDGIQRVEYGGRWFPVEADQYDSAIRLERMEAMGLSGAILAPTPWLFFYDAPVAVGVEHCRRANASMARLVDQLGATYEGMALVPLQDVDAAVRALRHAQEDLHLSAVEIGCHVDGRELDNGFDPFFAAAEALDMPVFLHPLGSGFGPRLGRYYLSNLIGVPVDTAIAAACLLFGGVLERHPGLRVVLYHGGGAVLPLLGRWEHGYWERPEAHAQASQPPSAFLSQLYFDSLTHDPTHLRHLVERVGGDHVVLGTDYPFDMGDHTPLEHLRRAGLDAKTVAAISGETARDTLHLGRSALAPTHADA